MRKQKSSKKRLSKQHARANAKPRRRGSRVPLEALTNEAVGKLERHAMRRHGTSITHSEARQLAAEIGRTISHKYRLNDGWDEQRHLLACLRERADILSGSYDPANTAQYEI